MIFFIRLTENGIFIYFFFILGGRIIAFTSLKATGADVSIHGKSLQGFPSNATQLINPQAGSSSHLIFDSPTLVRLFQTKDHVYFFFREKGVEFSDGVFFTIF